MQQWESLCKHQKRHLVKRSFPESEDALIIKALQKWLKKGDIPNDVKAAQAVVKPQPTQAEQRADEAMRREVVARKHEPAYASSSSCAGVGASAGCGAGAPVMTLSQAVVRVVDSYKNGIADCHSRHSEVWKRVIVNVPSADSANGNRAVVFQLHRNCMLPESIVDVAASIVDVAVVASTVTLIIVLLRRTCT